MGKERWKKALDVYPEAQRGKEEMMNEGEIRIRIWDTEEKKMIYPDTIESSGDYDSLYLNRKGKVMVFDDSDGGKDGLHEHLSCWISPDRFIPLLFTGLHDSTPWEKLSKEEQQSWLAQGKTKEEWNGKEIYEGDVIKKHDECPKYDKAVGRILWDNERMRFMIDIVRGHIWSFETPDGDNWLSEELEVIGNVYETPNLLRKEPEAQREKKAPPDQRRSGAKGE